MVNDLSKFKLTKDNAKEYYMLNRCKMMWIDMNGKENSVKFRGFLFDSETLKTWTNEWLKIQISNAIANLDFDVLKEFLDDYSDRINKDNTILLIKLYDLSRKNIDYQPKIELNLIYHYEEPVLLSKKFEYGLMFITYNNDLFIELGQLYDRFIEINDVLKLYNKKDIANIKKRFNL